MKCPLLKYFWEYSGNIILQNNSAWLLNTFIPRLKANFYFSTVKSNYLTILQCLEKIFVAVFLLCQFAEGTKNTNKCQIQKRI